MRSSKPSNASRRTPLGWGCLALLYAHEQVIGLNPQPDVLPRVRAATERALAIDSQNQRAWMAQGLSMTIVRDLIGLRTACERIVSTNPLDSHALVTAAIFLAFAGQTERAMQLVERALALNPQETGWTYYVPFLSAYGRRDYEAALVAAKRIRLPQFAWSHLSAAAAAGQLNRAADAHDALDGLRRNHPRLLDPEHARVEWQAQIWEDEFIDRLLDGFEKALVL